MWPRRFPVTEDMVIAALLHDAVEDAGGLPRLRDIEANFGKEVAAIVEGCTDSFAEDSTQKLEWKVRKQSYHRPSSQSVGRDTAGFSRRQALQRSRNSGRLQEHRPQSLESIPSRARKAALVFRRTSKGLPEERFQPPYRRTQASRHRTRSTLRSRAIANLAAGPPAARENRPKPLL